MALRAGEKKLRARMRERQRRMATAANTGEMRNIITLVPVSPTRLVCHEKYLKLGLYSTQAVHVDNTVYHTERKNDARIEEVEGRNKRPKGR